MTDRTVVVRLTAMVDQFRAGMAAAGQSVTALDAKVASSNAKTRTAMADMERSASSSSAKVGNAFKTVKTNLLMLGVPLAVGAIVKSFVDFDRQMAKVRAVSDDFGRSATGMKQLRDAALNMGQAYGFTAGQVGQAQEELAKAGISTRDIINGSLKASLTLAAAGSISLDAAATHIAVIKTQFGLQSGQTQDIADELSKAANATVSDVTGIATALQYAGGQLHAFGVPFHDAVTTIGMFSQAGIQADMAGTGLRGMLTALVAPSAMAKKTLKELGLTVWDSNNKFIGMRGVADVLNKTFATMAKNNPKQMAADVGRIFTHAEIPAVMTMIQAGAAGWDRMAKKIHDAASAEQTARDKLNNLGDDMRKFASAINTSAIKTLEPLNDALRGTAHVLTDAAKGFGNIGGAAQLAVAGLVLQAVYARKARASLQDLSGGIRETAVNYRDLQTTLKQPVTPSGSHGPAVFGPQLPTEADVGHLRAYAEQTSGIRGEVGRLAGAYMAAETAAGKFGVIAGGIGKGLKGAMSGLMGAVGGPWGLALSAGLAGFAMWQASVQASKDRVAELSSSLSSLGDIYNTTGKVTSDDVATLVKQDDQFRSLSTNARTYGLSLETVAQAAGHNQDAQKKVLAGMDTYESKLASLQHSIMTGKSDSQYWSDVLNPGRSKGSLSADQASQMKSLGLTPKSGDNMFNPMGKSEREKALSDLQDRVNLTKEQQRALKDEFGNQLLVNQALDAFDKANINDQLTKMGLSTAGASEGAKELASNLGVLDSADAKVADKMKAMAANVDLVQGSFSSLNDAQSAFFSAARDKLPQVLGKGGKGAPKAKVDWVTGQADVTTKQGADQNAVLSEMAKASANTIQVAYDKAYKATSGDAQAAGAVAVAAFERQRNAAIATVTTLTGNRKQAVALVDAYNAMPHDLALAIHAEGLDDTVEKLAHLGVQITTMPDGTFVVYAKTAKALTDVGAVNVQKIGDKKFRAILTNPGEVKKVLDGAAPKKTTAGVYVTDKGSINAVEHRLAAVAAKKNEAPIKAVALTDDAEHALIALTRPRQVQITANMPNLPSSIHIPVVATPPPNFATLPGPFGHQRWGGIHTFAGGGIAKVAGPGTLYQWAEPETGGEAFIPKRGDASRSKSILDTAAGWYGMKVMPLAHGGVMSFATGGVANGGVNAPLGDWFSRWGSPGTTKEDYTKAVTGRLAAVNALHKAEDKLHKVQADRKHTTAQLAAAENDLTLKHRALDAATDKLSKTTVSYNLSKQNAWERFRSSTKTGVTVTGNFLANLTKLANRGFGQLANQLLAMGGADAEAIASGAVKASDATVRGTAYRVSQGIAQQKAMDNMPATLALRGALRGHTSYESLVGSGQVDAASLNAAITLMQGELSKTSAGRAMIAAMNGANAQALKVDMAKFATGGIAPEGTMYRFAEPGTGGEAVIPRMGSNALPVLAKAAAWHGMTLSGQKPWDSVMQRAGGAGVQITVRGEGVLAGMIEATVDGKMVQVARAVRHGTRAA